MTVKELRELLAKAPDEMQVLIPTTNEFNGAFYSPCVKDSGVLEMGAEEESDETHEEVLLVPCGFFDEDKDHNHLLN